MIWILLMVGVGTLFGALLYRIHMPGGMLVGAILGAAAVHLITGQGHLDTWVRVSAQIVMATYVGCMITREDTRRPPKIIGPYLVTMATFLVMNLVVGVVIWKITSLDLLTALLSSCPGGVSDMPLIAMDMGAEASIVAVMQFTRMIFGMSALPGIIVLAGRGRRGRNGVMDALPEENQEGAHPHEAPGTLRRMIPVLILAGAAGTMGRISGIPAGAMIFSMLAAGTLKLNGHAPPMPLWIRRGAQALSGCCIGASITSDQLLAMRQMMVPALILMVAYTVTCVGMGHVVSRTFHIRLEEAMLGLSPAGASEMAMIAADMGIEGSNVVVLQVCRLVAVIVLFPQIFLLIVNIIG